MKRNKENNNEAVKIANALKPFAKKWFDEWGQSCVRSKKMTVTTAPNGSVIGVTDAFSEQEIFVKYMSSCSNAVVGDTVWVKWMYDNMQTLFADRIGNFDRDNYVPVSGGTFTGDVEFDGVVDIANRRAYGSLLSAGWYRVLEFTPTSTFGSYDLTGAIGALIDFDITRRYYWQGAENHKITLSFINSAIKFENEQSNSSVLGIDKIRYTRSSTTGYVDIHYICTQENQVGIDFSVHTPLEPNGLMYDFKSRNLVSVADAPTGETIVTTYSFSTNGVVLPSLDVVNRRCYSNLASAGWYRVLTFNSDATGIKGARGLEVRLNIQRVGENHSITFRTVGEGLVYWTDETSKSSTVLVDKVRYTYNTTALEGYIDIHYTYNQSRQVGVDFEAHVTALIEQSRVTANSLESVADAPSGETVMTTYSFEANGFVPNQSIMTTYGDLSLTGTADYQTPSAVNVATSTYTDVASVTLGVGKWILLLSIRFAKNATGYRYCRLSSTSGNSGSNFSMSANDMRPAFADEVTFTKSFDLVTNSAQRTLYLQAWQNSGSTLSCLGRIIAIQIC